MSMYRIPFKNISIDILAEDFKRGVIKVDDGRVYLYFSTIVSEDDSRKLAIGEPDIYENIEVVDKHGQFISLRSKKFEMFRGDDGSFFFSLPYEYVLTILDKKDEN